MGQNWKKRRKTTLRGDSTVLILGKLEPTTDFIPVLRNNCMTWWNVLESSMVRKSAWLSSLEISRSLHLQQQLLVTLCTKINLEIESNDLKYWLFVNGRHRKLKSRVLIRCCSVVLVTQNIINDHYLVGNHWTF